MGTLGSEKTDNTSNDGSSQNPIVVTNISRENPTTDISALGDPQSTMGVQMEKKSKASVVENGSSSFPMPPKAVSSKTVQSGAQQAEKTSIKSTGQNVTTSNKQSNVNANSGNDRVTVDKSHAPLVPSSNQGIAAQKAVESSSVTTTSNTSVTQVGISTISATPTNSNSEPKTPGSLKAPASPSNPAPPSPIDEQAVIEEAIRKSRAPLADKYGPYIVNSDTTLEEARSRLRTAIEQTRQLRSAFTERVYGKYRVCLRPPPSTEEMLTEILSDPEYTSREYFAEIKSLKEEKDIEKKESQKLNAEMMAATSNGEGNPLAAMNAENAEQLMFIGAGLSLIILPEQDVSDINMSGYKDRAPINPETGQRVRAISQAAAAAGEVMLDRARKGSAMREERMRRRQLKLLQGEDPENSADNNYSRLSLLSSSAAAAAIPVQKPSVPTVATGAVVQNAVATVPSTKATAGTPAKAIAPAPILISKNTVKKAAPKPPPSTLPSPANVKAIRARVQASMSVQTLLSLSPSAEELRIDGKTSAATMALLERGVGTRGVGLSSKTNQLRYRHPFPESHGGRRRSMGPGAALKKDSNTAADAFLQPSSYISMALPPLPTARERRMKKKIGVLESSKACSSRARTAIRSVLDQFVDGEWKETNDLAAGSDNFMRPKKRRISEISFLHGIQKIGDGVDSNEAESSSPKTPPLLAVTSPIEKSIDPILAFNVLKAVGMIKPSTSETDMETRRFDAGFDLSLFGVAEKRAMGEEGGQSRRSIGKLRSLWKKFSTKKRTFLEAFSNPITEEKLETTAPGTAEKEKSNQSQQEKPNTSEKDPVPIRETVTKPSNEASNMLETGANGTHENSEAQKKESKSEPIQSPPTVAIRGGGESLKDTSDRDKKSGQSQGAGQQPMNGALNNPDAVGSQGQVVRRNGPMNLPTADMATHRMVWDEGSHQPIVLINPQLGRAEQGYALTPASHPAHLIQHANGAAQAQRNARMQGMQSAEHYHHHTTNAIQLANHLRHATAAIQRVPPHGHPAAGDLETYIGGLHSQPAGAYDWSSINAANAAVAATHNSLAALGINPQRAAMVNFSVQDRARVLLAREQQHAAAAAAAHAAAAHRQQSLSSQQAVAFLGGAAANHGYPQTANPHFQHMAGPTTTAALLNSSAALMGHSGMAQVQSTNVQQPARLQPVNPDQRNAIVTKSDQSPNKDGDRMDHASSKEEGSIKDQQKEAAKRENAQKKDSSVGQKTSISRADIPANRKRALSDQDKIDAQPLKRGSSSEKQNKQTNSEPKNSSAASSVTKSAQRKPAPAPFLQGAQAPLPNKGGSQSGNDRKEKPGASDAPSQIKAKSEVSKDNSNTASTLAIPQKNTISSESTSDIHMDDASSTGQQRTGGMKFFVPPAPPGIPAEVARFVLAGKSHKAIEFMENSETPTDATALVEYLIAVGTAVPIPKALVATAFKERMSAPGPKSNSLGGIPALSREVVAASILLWLWRHHEGGFQKAFAKSGRIDVDPECKWLIYGAVEASVRALSQELADGGSRTARPLSAALTAFKNKGSSTPQKGPHGSEVDRLQAVTTKLDLLIASIVSKALVTGFAIDEQTDSLLPHFHDMLSYLDECRKCSLHSKSQERALLAALIARKATMSLPFSHAYASSMVRAGEALGHGELFEVVQNEEVHVSTMIPYDVFTDETGAWEDPCRPIEGFTQNLTGDDLMHRAHARAMIQKSLKKLQDRHSIKGGTPNPGPYTEPPGTGSGVNTESSKSPTGSNASTTPRGSWLKRRSSFSEPPIQPGTGSAPAISWSLYDPKHYSAPLIWSAGDNGPYGRHNKNSRPRSLSLSQGYAKLVGGKSSRGKGVSGRAMSVSIPERTKKEDAGGMLQSTREIAWTDVAAIFQPVQLPGMSQAKKESEAEAAPRKGTIFAPFVRKVELSSHNSESDSDEEEDLSDESVLARHKVVLDEMKEKLTAMLEARKKTQEERRKSRDKVKKV